MRARLASAGTFNEVEPNDTKAAANAFSLVPGDFLAGSPTGNSGTGLTSPDFFRLSFAAAAPGIYLHQLAIEPVTGSAFLGSLIGYSQTAGVIDTTSTVTVQFSVLAEKTNPSSVAYTRQAVSVTNLGTLTGSNVTISTSGSFDPDIALYDSTGGFLAQNDDSTTSLNSLLDASLMPGSYIVAVSLSNLANDRPNDANDAFRESNVLDAPNFLASASST